MPRPDKVQAVAEIKERFENARAVFLTEYRGIPVKEMGELRKALRESGADYKVVKMTLARRAVDELGIEGLDEHLAGPTALAFAQEDAVATAKALKDFKKTNENLAIKVGLLSNSLLTTDAITKLADIEPREVLLARIAGAMEAPLSGFAGMLGSFTRNSARMFSQLLEKKESGEFVPEATAAEAADDTPDTEEGPDDTQEDVATDELPTDDDDTDAAETAEEE